MKKTTILFVLLCLFTKAYSSNYYSLKIYLDGIYYDLDFTNMVAKVSPPAPIGPNGELYRYGKKVIIPKSITYKDKTYDVTIIGSAAFADGSYALTEITIPNSVTTIEGNAFYKCSKLIEITIPNSVTNIGEGAFAGCSGLTEIIIPSSVTNIGFGAFSGYSVTFTSLGSPSFSCCSALTNIIVDDNNPAYTSIDGILYNKDLSCILCFPSGKDIQQFIIPNSVTKIGDKAFWGCSKLAEITIPNSVTNIGNYAFGSCSALTEITIPNSITNIENYTFEFCSALTEITIPNSITTIGNGAFWGCSELTEIAIPNFVTTIGNEAFKGCNKLTNIYSFNTTPPNADVHTFTDNNYETSILYIPTGAIEAYQTSYPWYNFTNMIEINTTKIKGVKADVKQTTQNIYNLQGHKLYKTQSGINIINKHKVLIKN